AAIESALLDASSLTDAEMKQMHQLSAEQEELRQLFASQLERLALLRSQRDSLTVKSPLTGEILTCDTDQALLDRPVRRGQRWLTVADLNGPWEAELELPDDRVDRKSTRLNSSHVKISYAVFCLKKKKKTGKYK